MTRDKRLEKNKKIREQFAANLRQAMNVTPADATEETHPGHQRLARGRIKQFADAAGVTPAAVSNYLAGVRLPEAAVLPDVQSVVSEWLGRPVSIDELLMRNLKK